MSSDCLRSIHERSWRRSLVTTEHFDNEFTTIFNFIDAANSITKSWSVYLLKTQTCLSYWYVGCIERRCGATCKWSVGIWQCWATVSAVAWLACPSELRHDLTFILQSQDQSAKHLPRWRFRRKGKWARRWQKPFFIALYGQLLGTSLESARFILFIKKKKSPKVKALPQHQLIYSSTCCGPICRPCCGKQQTSKPHLTSQPISHSSAKRSGMASQLLLLLRLT